VGKHQALQSYSKVLLIISNQWPKPSPYQTTFEMVACKDAIRIPETFGLREVNYSFS
jgi:hypothetical protein